MSMFRLDEIFTFTITAVDWPWPTLSVAEIDTSKLVLSILLRGDVRNRSPVSVSM